MLAPNAAKAALAVNQRGPREIGQLRGKTNSTDITAETIHATLTGSDRCEAVNVIAVGHAPVLTLCRQLLERGIDPDIAMVVFRRGQVALRVRAIGQAAKLAVEDNKYGTPTSAKHVRKGVAQPRPLKKTAGGQHDSPPPHKSAPCGSPQAAGSGTAPEIRSRSQTTGRLCSGAHNRRVPRSEGGLAHDLHHAVEAAMSALEQTETRSKKVRGMARKSLELIEAMHAAAKAAHPITGRGIGYKLFTTGLIPSMEQANMQRVYRLLKEARERGMIPWEWIVDETRELERRPSWADPADFVRTARRAYRRDHWDTQPLRVEVWSEKGTVRGVLAPVLDRYGVGFRVMHGFSGATTVYDVAQDDDGRPMVALYVGDWDPSGLCMSEQDLPNRVAKYGGDHIILIRVALRLEHLDGLPSFPASDKNEDTRYKWFVRNFGERCWELDALDPNDLRELAEEAIKNHIEPRAWERSVVIEQAQCESLRTVLDSWKGVS
jgi:hypothetical protein